MAEGDLARVRRYWPIAEASLAYIRDVAQISRGDGELLAPLIFTAILDANMAPVTRDPELHIRYGGADLSAPDELRRPVSVNAVAQSLQLPFETVRRRVTELARAGQCVVTPRGVYIPRVAVTSPRYNAIQRARFDRTRLLYEALKTTAALPLTDDPADLPVMDGPPIRAANRVVSEYMLRAAGHLIGLTGDVLSSLILVELVLHNLTGGRRNGGVGDDMGGLKPARISGIARNLGLPAETTRRHVMRLQAAGLCQRLGSGLFAVASPQHHGALANLMAANVSNLQRMFSRLRVLGLLAAWDAGEDVWSEQAPAMTA